MGGNTTDEISYEKTCTWLWKGSFKRETESLLIAVQNNTIRTNYIKAKIDNTQQNSKCRLCGEKDEMINYIVSECSKLAQKKYKTRHDWVGKTIHWEWCNLPKRTSHIKELRYKKSPNLDKKTRRSDN